MGNIFQQLEQNLLGTIAAPGQLVQGTAIRLINTAQANQQQLVNHVTQQVVAPLVQHVVTAGLAELAHLAGVPAQAPTQQLQVDLPAGFPPSPVHPVTK